jgi:cysteine synthase
LALDAGTRTQTGATDPEGDRLAVVAAIPDPSALGLEGAVVDAAARDRAVARCRQERIVLPTFAELADPATIPRSVRRALGDVDPDAPDPRNLFRVHWHNVAGDRAALAERPEHVVVPKELTGVDAHIVVAFGDRFPMIGAHKVLAAYSCLAPRVVTGQFDPTFHRAVWPSTGNYARGGVAIARIMGCRGVAVLPENMSRERFDWLDRWVADPEDVIRTPGSESNVKEIYDECARLAADPGNFVLNQFSELSNHLGHHTVTGPALEQLFEGLCQRQPGLRLAAFVAASGSAGTLGAGDYLKDRHGARIVAVEALECPTMLYNGFGEHNIQGIGDKHIPFIHNVMNTDLAVAVSDRATDDLGLLFDQHEGRAFLRDRLGVPASMIEALPHFGLSSICNLVAAIKVARHQHLGPDDVIVTVATDGAALYGSERDRLLRGRYRSGFGPAEAAAVYARHVEGASVDHVLECGRVERTRIFNLGYFTWVEQQGVPLELFEARREQAFWRELRSYVPLWDDLIREFNDRAGVAAA